MKLLAAGTLVIALVAAACSGGDSESSPTPATATATATVEATTTATPEPSTPTPRERGLLDLSSEDLAIMVLPAAEFGSAVDGFEVSPDSGPEAAGDVADATFSPTDTAEEWAAAGYVEGYELTYDPADIDARFEAGDGVSEISSWVAIWDDDDAASAGMAAAAADISNALGTEVAGVTIAAFEEYEAPALGDERIGFQAVAEFNNFAIESGVTRVLFRVGRLTGGVWIARFGSPTAGDQVDVDRFAAALEARIEQVLLGELDADPVPIPTETAGSTDGPPPGTPDLSVLALGTEDLPAGIIVDSEGYDPDPAGLSEYERDFDALGQTLGNSELLELESTIHLFRNGAVAATFMEFMSDFLTGPAGVEAFAQGEFSVVIDEIGAEPVELGDEAVLLSATGSSPIGEVQFVFYLVRVDSFMSMLIASGRTDRFSIDDIAPFADLVAERLRQ